MVNNDDFFKGRKPAAVLKHAVFASYAHAFFSMVGSGHDGPLWLVDGYAGPGRYGANDGGIQVNGSPIVALELAAKQREFSTPRDIRCAFIEANKAYAKSLAENIKPFVDQGLHADVFQGSVAEHLPMVWSKAANDPVLTLIDPFGVSAVSKEAMTGMLLKPGRRAPSEVLVNINVEAISRHGGYLQWSGVDGGEPEVRPDLRSHGVELSDAFFGGSWWRRAFLEHRDLTGDASAAAVHVVDLYRAAVGKETGKSSLAVPIRRSPTGATLFYFTLFFTHPAAGYKFADAAAKGSQKWREVYRQKDLEEALASEEEQATLFGDFLQEFSERDAKNREAALLADAVAHIEVNVRRMLASMQSGQGFQIAAKVEHLLGDYLSLAGEPAIRRAWDGLADAGVVQARDKTKSRMWTQFIIKR